MTFKCGQNWHEMKISGAGRQCDLCNLVVHDFAGKPVAEVARLSEGKALCGSFSPEQLEDGLVPIQVPPALKAAMLTTAAVLGLELNHGYAQNPENRAAMEVVDSAAAVQSNRVTPTPNQPSVTMGGKEACVERRHPHRPRYYLSWRFPFIKRRFPRVMGRYRF